jgi:hypothetical protein
MADEIGKFERAARAAGGVAVVHFGRLAYGTRRDANLCPCPLGADVAADRRSAIGRGPRSVWNGPRRAAQPGAPILQRAKP